MAIGVTGKHIDRGSNYLAPELSVTNRVLRVYAYYSSIYFKTVDQKK